MNIRTQFVAVSEPLASRARRSVPWTELLPGLLMLADALAIALAAGITYLTLVEGSEYVRQFYAFAGGFVLLATVLLLRGGGLYRTQSMLSAGKSASIVLVAVATALLFLLTTLHALKTSALYQTDWLLVFSGSVMAVLVALRFLTCALVKVLLHSGRIGRRTAVFGTGAHIGRFLDRLSAHGACLTAVTAIYDPVASLVGDRPTAGGLTDLVRSARECAFDDIVIALPESEAELCNDVIERLRELPVDVYLAPRISEFGRRMRPVHLQDSLPMFEVWQRPISGWSRYLKLAEGYVLASLVLVLLLPVLLLIAIAIRLDSAGPVLFRQERLGFNNEVFEIFKFRTMYQREGTETRVKQATRNDPRITRVGWFLRRTSLDELPQLLNVLNGTMSLVGPRPHAISHNADFSGVVRGYFGRHKVKPGITGWAQVNGLRGEIDSHDKLVARIAHDVHYAENWSLLFDLRILVVTAMVVLFQRSAY